MGKRHNWFIPFPLNVASLLQSSNPQNPFKNNSNNNSNNENGKHFGISQTASPRPQKLIWFFFERQKLLTSLGSYKKTCRLLSTVDFLINDILIIIRDLNPSKVYGHDMISIPIFKVCGESICE